MTAEPARVVQEAARATLAAGSARIRTMLDTAWEAESARFGSVGVVDLDRRLSMREDRSRFIDELAAKIERWWPFGGDDEDDEEPQLTYEQGSTLITGMGGRWIRVDQEHRSFRDPTLVLDLLVEHPLEGAQREAGEDVRGTTCARYGGRLDSRRMQAVLGGTTAHPDRTVYVKAWVDPDGRLVRGSWSLARVGRPRLRRWEGRHSTSPSRTVEFWDFGLPVDIELPTNVERA